MYKTLVLLALFVPAITQAQDIGWEDDDDEEEFEKPIASFTDTRVINGHSVEVLEPKTLDFNVSHKFGDMASTESYRRLFGLDVSSDIRIAFEYGLFKGMNIGFGRSKGAGPFTEFYDGYLKYQILQQSNKMPLSMTVVGSAFLTGMKSNDDPYAINHFTNTAHRFSYYTQLMIARNFADIFTLQIAPGLSYRNLVFYDDQNALFSLGVMPKVHVWKKISVLAEYYHVFRKENTFLGTEYVNSLGFGVEIKTFAHVFQINITNARGFGEGQFIPYTYSKFSEGQFRLGFKISRHFDFNNAGKKKKKTKN